MSDQPDQDQKTEAPSPKRLADAARDGDILQSRELGTALVMIAGAAWLLVAGPWFMQMCVDLLRNGLTLDRQEVMQFDPATSATRLIGMTILPLASLMALCTLGAIAGPAMLGSAGFRAKAMGFKPSKLDPVAGFARIFGMQGVIELGKALAKAIVLGFCGYKLIMIDMPLIIGLGASDIRSAAVALGGSLTTAILYLSLGLAAIAGIDVPIQWVRRNARLRMTKQEVKEEHRQNEGSPELKQAVRQRQHQILSNSVRKGVSEASVILTNPTHFAVALRYVPGKDFAPIVVARGRDETALAIRALANESNVPTLEYPKLARAIYFTAKTGQPVAEDLYIAIAAILAFVFNIERAVAEGVSAPVVTVPDDKSFDENGMLNRSPRKAG
jgi:flagellar biosynthesis protein FlhB